MSDDIVARLRNAPWTTADDCNKAADEIERLRKERDELAARCGRTEAKLATYKRAYARACCKDLYLSGARWKTRPNPMRDDGVFVEEDCEHGKNRTWWAFPVQFEEDVANEIVELLNRATDELRGNP
jgi:hypothetical protein